jgi:NAD(P)-dependent dehydrogenase (short-subunit alcohol dehydrogenase family)
MGKGVVRVSFDFSGARVLVTGGSNGIGLGIARAYRDAGATVTITGTRASVGEYDHDLSDFAYQQCVLTQPDTITDAAKALDGLDVLVNNAGENLPGGRSEWDAGVFEEVVTINLFGAWRMSNACREHLAASELDGGASVLNLGSMTSFFGLEIVPGYGAAKAGVVQLTKTLASSWAPQGIRVNAIAPGVTVSNMTAGMLDVPELMDPILARTPMQRIATPDDVAPVALFLTSPAARFVTGQTLPIDGGFSIQG